MAVSAGLGWSEESPDWLVIGILLLDHRWSFLLLYLLGLFSLLLFFVLRRTFFFLGDLAYLDHEAAIFHQAYLGSHCIDLSHSLDQLYNTCVHYKLFGLATADWTSPTPMLETVH